MTVFFCVWRGRPSRNLWQMLALAGSTGFATAIGIHPIIGYLSVSHLAPAVAACGLFIMALAVCARPMLAPAPSPPPVTVAKTKSITSTTGWHYSRRHNPFILSASVPDFSGNISCSSPGTPGEVG